MGNNQDTICAIATAPGGAIGLIRLSGAESVAIVDRIFSPRGGKGLALANRKPNTITFGDIADAKGNVVDEVLVSVFRSPHSYTGEDSVEISCHGSRYILQQVMQLLIDNGCRQALPGEYTQRAFLNGKMDLSQAEAVADLIASSSSAQHRIAIGQMRGGMSSELARLREKLLHLATLLELEIDFSDHEELEFANRDELCDISHDTATAIEKLLQSFGTGQAIKNGVPVAIVGATNAGKSSLLNRLVGEDKAIVSDIHGTTRDVIEDTVEIDGTTFRFIDTAGLRQTNDKIEQMGIERSYREIDKASIVLYVIDSTLPQDQTESVVERIKSLCSDKSLIIIYNKADIVHRQTPCAGKLQASAIGHQPSPCADSQQANGLKDTPSVVVSAKTGEGIDDLLRQLSAYAETNNAYNGVVVSNVRHYEALSCALSAINRVCEGLSSGLPSDLISQDLRECLFHLAEITGGEITTPEVLENVFKHFCVGK